MMVEMERLGNRGSVQESKPPSPGYTRLNFA